ncbi:MAG: hypothetical protein SGI72_01175 [Planctomycetota bacterium]|nr:hypothetical protein [Planctomycetota bacterium]
MPLPILLLPAILQAIAMIADEGVFHRRRGLDRWERLGHPFDALCVAGCYAWLLSNSPRDEHALSIYIAAAAASCVLITKDEFVHARVCKPLEHWLHAVLFVLHPIVFLAFGVLWWNGDSAPWLIGQLVLTVACALSQAVYWSKPCKTAR